jgi:hypothetical protein
VSRESVDDRGPQPAPSACPATGGIRRRNGTLEDTIRFLLAFAAAVAAVVVFAWTSQARQDERIRRNETAVAVIGARLESICEKLEDIRAILGGSSARRGE